MSPSKVANSRKGGMKSQLDMKLNREINGAIKQMDKVVKFAFDD